VDTFIEAVLQLEGEEPKPAGASNLVNHVSSFIKTYGQQRMFSNMEADIVDVARKISYLWGFRTQREIRTIEEELCYLHLLPR
jgi:hypothetical protein